MGKEYKRLCSRRPFSNRPQFCDEGEGQILDDLERLVISKGSIISVDDLSEDRNIFRYFVPEPTKIGVWTPLLPRAKWMASKAGQGDAASKNK